MNPKAQISAEFIIFVGLAFLITIAFVVISLDQLNDFRIKKEDEAVKDLTLKLQRELLLAATVEDGYIRTFTIPNKLERVNYSITMQNSTMTVESKNSLYIVAIPNSVGNINKGTNNINKTGGVIYIN